MVNRSAQQTLVWTSGTGSTSAALVAVEIIAGGTIEQPVLAIR
jgi:hypothetical protein